MFDKCDFRVRIDDLFVLQVVELISSAIGDVVQGIYYENHSSAEVNKLLFILLTIRCVFMDVKNKKLQLDV